MLKRLLLTSLLGVAAASPAPAQGAPPAADPPQEQRQPEVIVESILVEGARRYTESQLLSALGQGVEVPLDQEAIRRGIEILFRTFRVRADVEYQQGSAPDRIRLRLRVRELPFDLEPRFLGNVGVNDEKLLEWARLGGEGELFLFETPRVRDRLVEAYRREGYHFAEVRVVEREGGVDAETGEFVPPDVIFEIIEGPQVRVRGVEMRGNEILPEDGFLFFSRGLKGLAEMETKGPRFLGLFPRKFDRQVLDADIVALRDVYRDYGYLDAIVQLERLEWSDDRSWVTVHIVVDEGEAFTVGSVNVEGVEFFQDESQGGGLNIRPVELVFPEEELVELLELRPGEVFQRRLRETDERVLRTKFAEQGYIDHPSIPRVDRWEFLDPELVFEPDRPVVHVTYVLAQGQQQFIREILTKGNLHTQDRVIRRLLTVEPGDVANPAEIARSRQRVQSTGFFSNQFNLIEHREPTFRFLETGDRNWKDLEYEVEEGNVLNFNISGGVSSNTGAFGLISLTQRNFDLTNLPDSAGSLVRDVAERTAFHGAGQELRIEAAPGTEVSFFNVLFREPDIFRRHVNRISMSLNARKQLRRFESHDEQRTEYSIRMGRQLGPDSSIVFGYHVGEIDVDELEEGGEPGLDTPLFVPQLLQQQEGTNDLAFVELAYNLRTVDSRINPRQGQALQLSTRFYDGAIGSDFDFIRTEGVYDWYQELDDTNPGASHRVHLALRGGVATPYGDTETVPYSERFFLGGQRTLRGFDFRGVGPNENGFPIGGETYAYASFEYKRPLVTTIQPGTYRQLETVFGGLFIDAGVLDPDDFSLDLDELRVSAGFLFGISVPLPITFSFGFPLEEGQDDDEQVIGFNIGF